MKHLGASILILLLLVSALAQAETAVPPLRECQPGPSDGRYSVLFQKVELEELIQTVADATCKTFVVPDSLKGKVSLIGPENGQGKLSLEQFYAAFLRVLDASGLTVTGEGPVLRVVEKNHARKSGIPFVLDAVAGSDVMVTRVFRLENVELEPVRGLLSQLASDPQAVVPFPPDTLVISDLGANLERFDRILSELDGARPSTEQLRIFQVNHADAEELAEKLLRSTESKRTPKEPPSTGDFRILADARTNKLVVFGNEAAFARVELLLGELDVPIPGDEQVNVYMLENGDAKEIAANLEQLLGSRAKPRHAGGPPGPVETQGFAFTGDIKITANESKNALLIVASPGDYRSLSKVIEQLDTPQRQVLIETVIMEVSVGRVSESGITAHGVVPVPTAAGNLPLILGSQPVGTTSSVAVESLLGANGLLAGLQGPQVELLKGKASVSSFGLMLHALQTNSDVNVLSMPHILTTDNKEAEISVGQKVPFQTGVPTSAISKLLESSGAANTAAFTALAPQVSREPVELKLTVKPHIGDGDNVRLEINQQTEELGGENEFGQITSTRGEKTTVIARDRETVMLGGIMQDRFVEKASKTPLLSDIPLIGRLFRYSKKEKVKTNLLVFLTPHIIRSPGDLQRLSEEKMKERERLLAQFYGASPFTERLEATASSRPGPLRSMARTLARERRRPENGGSGNPGERVVQPQN